MAALFSFYTLDSPTQVPNWVCLSKVKRVSLKRLRTP